MRRPAAARANSRGWAAKWLRREIPPGLLRHHVRGIPSGLVLVLARPRALLVLDMGSLGTPKCVFQVIRRREGRFRGVDSARVPSSDLLDKPQIVVGIVEGAERPVAGALGVGAGLPRLGRERRAVPHITHVDTAADERFM